MYVTDFNYETGEMKVNCGQSFDEAVCNAWLSAIAERHYDSPLDKVFFVFNGVTVNVAYDSRTDLLKRDFRRAMDGCIDKNIGPYPKPELSEDEKAADLRVYERNNERQKKWREEVEAKRAREKANLATMLQKAPAIELSDPDGWEKTKENNTDAYGSAALRFAENWARLMQLELASGKSLEDVALPTSDRADVDGITGFMFGAAASTLSHCWKYGQELKTLREKGVI